MLVSSIDEGMKTSIEGIAVMVNMAAFTRPPSPPKMCCYIFNLAVLVLGIHPEEIMEVQYGLAMNGSAQWSYRPHLNPDSTTSLPCGL